MHWAKNAVACAILLLSAMSLPTAAQEDNHSGAIKTAYGYLLVWNGAGDYYTLEIKGTDVRQISLERKNFNVDGMFLQITTAPLLNFLTDEKSDKLDDKTILTAHRDWEVKYMEGQYRETLSPVSSWQKLPNGKDALLWQVAVPKSANSNVAKQIYLTVVKGNRVLMLGGVVTAAVAESNTNTMLLNTVASLKTSDQPFDLHKLSEAQRAPVAP